MSYEHKTKKKLSSKFLIKVMIAANVFIVILNMSLATIMQIPLWLSVPLAFVSVLAGIAGVLAGARIYEKFF